MSKEKLDALRKKLLGESDDLNHVEKIDDLNKSIAINACKYAREFITGGRTQIENNGYHPDIRYQLNIDIQKLYAGMSELNYKTFSWELESNLRTFYCFVDTCKKLMRGNCHELAFMALDYVLQYAPYMNAEIYDISEGDHVFLVIGRDPESQESKTETWGSSTYICDPWANKIYRASEYLTELYDYYTLSQYAPEHRTRDGKPTYTNHAKRFDPHTQCLVKTYDFGFNKRDTFSLYGELSKNRISLIRAEFEKKTYAVIESIELLDSRLEHLKTRYKPNDPKAVLIKQIREKLKDAVAVFRAPLQNNIYFLPTNLEDNLSKCEKILKETTALSVDEYQKIRKHRCFGGLDKNSFLTDKLRFLGIYSQSEKQYKNAVDDAIETVKNIMRKS